LIQFLANVLSMFLTKAFFTFPPSLDIGSYSLVELLIFAALVIVGIMVLIFLIKLVFWLIPAAIVAFIVWFLTSSLWLAGIAFLIIAALSIIRKI
jgi:hypothetical protein